MITRLKFAFQLFRCAMWHGMTTYRNGLRCTRCNPVRKRRMMPEDEA